MKGNHRAQHSPQTIVILEFPIQRRQQFDRIANRLGVFKVETIGKYDVRRQDGSGGAGYITLTSFLPCVSRFR